VSLYIPRLLPLSLLTLFLARSPVVFASEDSLLAAWKRSYDVERAKVDFEPEWAYNISAPRNGPPQLGLALSGGGMRSGAFSIGILERFRKSGILSKLDAISSVSGGGYAASWYYIQHSLNVDSLGRAVPVDPQELFSVSQRFQCYLERHGELWGTRPPTPFILDFPYIWLGTYR
jgi:hypothetical protein